MKANKTLLGIFDSGVGGFSVLQKVRKETDADIIYFGDCARAPYGDKDEKDIIVLVKEILTSLQTKGATHFISACNSMSVHTTEKVLAEARIPKDRYMDMRDAVAKITFPSDVKVLIVGTQATLNSSVYQSILHRKNISHSVFIPHTLAREIEKNDTEAIAHSVRQIMAAALAADATHIVYACTHYPLVDEVFQEEAKESRWNGKFIDPATQLAEEMQKWNLQGENQTLFETSLETDVFKDYSSRAW